jgi:hypothetical protein
MKPLKYLNHRGVGRKNQYHKKTASSIAEEGGFWWFKNLSGKTKWDKIKTFLNDGIGHYGVSK